MNPLSSWTYWLRHRGRTALILGLIAFSTAGLYSVIAAVLILRSEPFPANTTFLRTGSLVDAVDTSELDPGLLAQLRTHPDIVAVMPADNVELAIPSLIAGDYYGFLLLLLNDDNIATVMQANGVRVKAGRLSQPRSNEFMLAEEVATALGLQLGDEISRSQDENRYRAIDHPLRLVGILQGAVRLGIASAEYAHSFHSGQGGNSHVLVLAKPGRASDVDAYLVNQVRSNRAEVFTLSIREADHLRSVRTSITLFAPIAFFLSLVLMAVIGVIQRLDLLRRLPDLGMLHVIGLPKHSLLRQLTGENVGLALLGWLLGLLLPMLILQIVIVYLFVPRGYLITAFQAPAFWLTVPIPLAVMLFTVITLRRRFAQLDGIALIEHGEAPSNRQKQQPDWGVAVTGNPLSPFTFYQRHRARTLLLIGAMALMIMAVALIAFLFTTSIDASMTSLGKLRLMTQVSVNRVPQASSGAIAQIRTHPTVARLIPTKVFIPLEIAVPPFSRTALETFAVGADDLHYLVDLYGLQIKAGRLPEPRTNQLIIAEAVAQNHNLKVGDVIGDHKSSAFDAGLTLPVPFVVAGIFARASVPAEENWLSFASLEFVESNAAFSIGNGFLVVAKAGQKAAMDGWLEQNISNAGIDVSSYQEQIDLFYALVNNVLIAIGIIEGVIALVAAAALGVLNYIFVGQRQAEFGVLHALGYRRRWLIGRTVRESFYISLLAWGLSVLLCFAGLVYMQYGLFQPRGLALNFFNPTPWYFTLPVPLAVLFASVFTVTRFFRRLDPVAVIEKA